MTTPRTLAILVFDDVEVLDFCGPFEVFSVANRFTDPPAFHVFTVAEKPGPVLTRSGLNVNPHYRLADCLRPNLLLVPGGQGTRREMHNPVLTDWIKARSKKAELVLSVCTGALLLAKTGLLDGLEATTHHGAIDLLRETAPKTTVHADRRFVDNGRVVCSAGIAAGIDMSLHVIGGVRGGGGGRKNGGPAGGPRAAATGRGRAQPKRRGGRHEPQDQGLLGLRLTVLLPCRVPASRSRPGEGCRGRVDAVRASARTAPDPAARRRLPPAGVAAVGLPPGPADGRGDHTA